MAGLSPRLLAIVDALPLADDMRVLEIGGGPGAAAREVARRLGGGHILAIDRSANAIALARAASAAEIASACARSPLSFCSSSRARRLTTSLSQRASARLMGATRKRRPTPGAASLPR